MIIYIDVCKNVNFTVYDAVKPNKNPEEIKWANKYYLLKNYVNRFALNNGSWLWLG